MEWLILSGILFLFVFSYIGQELVKIIESNNAAKGKKEKGTPKTLADFSSKKTFKVNEGDQFPIRIESIVTNIFFYKDLKFGVFVPIIFDTLVPIPITAEIDDSNKVIWDTVNIDEGVKSKALSLFREYKKQNRERFI